MLDEQLFERCISKEDMMLYDFTNLNQDLKERPNMSFTPDDDKLLAEVLNEESDKIWSVHKHDDLLQHQVEELLSEEEVQHAWDIFQQEEELKRLLPKRVQKEMLDNIFAKPTKENSTKIPLNMKSTQYASCIGKSKQMEVPGGSFVRNDGTYWQKDKQWKGTIKWGDSIETECQVSTCRHVKDDTNGEQRSNLKETLNVRFFTKQLFKRIPRNPSFEIHVFDLWNKEDANLSNIKEKLKENVALEVDEEFCIILTTKQDDDKTLIVGLTTNDSTFCKQVLLCSLKDWKWGSGDCDALGEGSLTDPYCGSFERYLPTFLFPTSALLPFQEDGGFLSAWKSFFQQRNNFCQHRNHFCHFDKNLLSKAGRSVAAAESSCSLFVKQHHGAANDP